MAVAANELSASSIRSYSDAEAFFETFVRRLIGEGVLTREDRILVVCGGPSDADSLRTAGFVNVTISNLDERMDAGRYEPFDWSFQNAESLSFPDNSFDFTIVQDGLHHCYCPPRAIAEMLRVSRKGILAIEPKDGLFIRLGGRLGFGQIYEDAAVAGNDGKFGGVENSPIPNYIYRFDEPAVDKLARCLLPLGIPELKFAYRLRINWTRFDLLKNKLFQRAIHLFAPLLTGLGNKVPAFANTIAFAILKPTPADYHPWIMNGPSGPDINLPWLQEKYSVTSRPR